MSLSLIRAEIKSILEGVSGMGNVYDYLRHSSNVNNMLEFFKSKANKYHVWSITRTAVSDHALTQAQNYIRTHNFEITGFYGLNDSTESEKTFQDLIEAVLDALRVALKLPAPLNGTALNATVPKAEPIDRRKYVKVLSHACRITFTVDEYIPPS